MLGPDEQKAISNAAEGLAKGALAPLHDVVRELAGPAASEIGSSFGQQLRLWRLSRTVRFVSKLQERLEPIGINRRAVALKLLVGAVENGTIEEEDELQDLWAALLSSAADSREPAVHPSFPDILHQMTARDAKLLTLIAKMQLALRNTIPYEPVKIMEVRPQSGGCGFDTSDAGAFDFYISAETLIRLRMLEPRDVSQQSISGSGRYGAYIVTNLGWAFLRAVMDPAQYKELAKSAA